MRHALVDGQHEVVRHQQQIFFVGLYGGSGSGFSPGSSIVVDGGDV
jgi:hypothetical protein